MCSPRAIHKDTVEIACRNVPAGESRAESHLDYRNRVWSLWPCKCSHWQKETKNMFQHSFTAGKYFRKKTFHLFIFWQQHRRIMDYLTGINSRNRSVKWTWKNSCWSLLKMGLCCYYQAFFSPGSCFSKRESWTAHIQNTNLINKHLNLLCDI